MNDVEFLADQLQRAYRGSAWHGPSVREVLAGVTAAQAAVKPAPGAHCIWELVMHIGAWISTTRRRLAGDTREVTAQEDWPAIESGNVEAWQQTLATLDDEHNQLHQAVRSLPEAALKTRLEGTDYSVRFMLQGVIQHNLYHAGQIALAKKLV